jgi:hypothetical protein
MGRPDRPASRAVIGTVAPLRLRGRLRRTERGFLLDMEDGHVWRLNGAQDFPPLVDAVVVEGRKASPSLLDVLWLGPA